MVQHFVGQERTISELAARMDVTQQAASKSVAELVDRGVLEVAASADRRAKRMRLSARGQDAVTRAPAARRRIEGRLVRKMGTAEYAAGKRIVLACLEALGGLHRIETRRIRAPR